MKYTQGNLHEPNRDIPDPTQGAPGLKQKKA